jgi:hypothetical protein
MIAEVADHSASWDCAPLKTPANTVRHVPVVTHAHSPIAMLILVPSPPPAWPETVLELTHRVSWHIDDVFGVIHQRLNNA